MGESGSGLLVFTLEMRASLLQLQAFRWDSWSCVDCNDCPPGDCMIQIDQKNEAILLPIYG